MHTTPTATRSSSFNDQPPPNRPASSSCADTTPEPAREAVRGRLLKRQAVPSHHASTPERGEGVSSGSVSPRCTRGRSGRDPNVCGRAATVRLAAASTARPPPPSGDLARGSSPRSCRVCSTCFVAVQGCPGSPPVHDAGQQVPPAQSPSGSLERKEVRSPAVVLDLGSLGRDVVGRRVRELAQHLPADGRIAVERPVDHAHRSTTSCGAQGPPNADTRPRSRRTRSNAPTESGGRAAARLGHDVRLAAVAWSLSLSGGPRGRRYAVGTPCTRPLQVGARPCGAANLPLSRPLHLGGG